MFNPAFIADRQRDIRIQEGMFAGGSSMTKYRDYPGAKWLQRDPSSTAFGPRSYGDVSAVNVANRMRNLQQAMISNRLRPRQTMLSRDPAASSFGRAVRYNGYGGFHRFGAYGDDFDTSQFDTSTIADPTLGDTPLTDTSGDSVGYVTDATSGSASQAGDSSSFWNSAGTFLTGLVTTGGKLLGGSTAPAAGGAQTPGLLGQLLSAIGVGGAKPGAPAAPVQQKSNVPLYVGGAAVLFGLYLATKHH